MQVKTGILWDMWEKGGLDMVVETLPNGMKIVNTTPHPLMFSYKPKNNSKKRKIVEIKKGEDDIIEGFYADAIEEQIGYINSSVTLVTPKFKPRYPDKIQKALEWAEKNDIYFICSILTAMAVPHKRVLMPITDTRKSTSNHFKTAYIDKFSTFAKG